MNRRNQRLAAQLGSFMDEYGRPKRPGSGEPNDRHYDRKLERVVKRLPPEELGALLEGELEPEDGDLHDHGAAADRPDP